MEQAPSAVPDDAAVQVMVLGTYHFAGGNQDVLTVATDNVLTERRQRELVAVADALATYQPTVIFTERVTRPPDYVDTSFSAFSEAQLRTVADERVQIAYRLAKRVDVSRVHGIDERPTDSEPDYFPFGKLMAHAAATGQKSQLDALLEQTQAMVNGFTREMKDLPMAERLARVNAGPMSKPDVYYELAAFDVAEQQPAAELQAYWFMRNAKIWSKLRDLVRPGDRALVVFGAGHKFWLEHMARHSKGFEVVDPVPILRRAVSRP